MTVYMYMCSSTQKNSMAGMYSRSNNCQLVFLCLHPPIRPLEGLQEMESLASQELDNEAWTPELSVLIIFPQSNHLCCCTHLDSARGG